MTRTIPADVASPHEVLPLEHRTSRVLVVEDEFINQQIMMAVLAKNGYDYRLATRGEEALAMLANFEPDLVLLDVLMPGIDGFEVVTRLKKMPEMMAVPVILVTALSDKASRIAGLTSGAEDFITKPIDPQELGARMHNLLRLKKLHDFLKAHNRTLAQYDTLTGLPNRALFQDRLVHDFAAVERSGGEVGMLVLDVNDLKRINDSLGLAAGDILIRQVADRIVAASEEGDMVARLAGGEFAVVMRRPLGVEEAMRHLGQNLLNGLSRPFHLGEQELFISLGMGGSRFPGDATDQEEFMRKAGVALSQAKRQRRNTFVFYAPGMEDQERARLTLESRLHHVLERGEVQVFYQPKVTCDTGRIVGMEALIRWFSPEFGMVSPNRFIPLAEDTNLIVPIGAWVLREACRQTRVWRDAGFPLQVAVNLSARQFLQRGLVAMVEETLAESGLEPHELELEITESCAIGDVEHSIAVIRELAARGVHCALDDFGTGYSSLNHLKRLPIHTLKLDRSFLHQVPHERADARIVRSLIAMAHDLELTVVAEGVERTEQIAFLRENGCDLLQGFHFSKPLPAEEFFALVKSPPHDDPAPVRGAGS